MRLGERDEVHQEELEDLVEVRRGEGTQGALWACESTLSIAREKAARGFTIYVKYVLLLERTHNLLLAGLKFYLGVFEGDSLLLRLENAL